METPSFSQPNHDPLEMKPKIKVYRQLQNNETLIHEWHIWKTKPQNKHKNANKQTTFWEDTIEFVCIAFLVSESDYIQLQMLNLNGIL